MWPCVNTAVCNGLADHRRSVACTCLAWNTPLVSTTTRPSSVSTAALFANASTNTRPGCTSASSPLDANGWCDSIGASPVKSRSASSSSSIAVPPRVAAARAARRSTLPGGRPAAPGPLPVLAAEKRTCSTFSVSDAMPAGADDLPATGSTALARSQAARRRRVLDATLRLASEGGFDAVQMRDVAAAADVALGTVYRYFSSKERLLLEAMAEQQADLRTYLQSHPAPGATAAE